MSEATITLTREQIAESVARVRKFNERLVPAGMTRSALPPWKRAILARMGGLGPFGEGPEPRPTQLPARRQ
jgi:hypothetical protein